MNAAWSLALAIGSWSCASAQAPESASIGEPAPELPPLPGGPFPISVSLPDTVVSLSIDLNTAELQQFLERAMPANDTVSFTRQPIDQRSLDGRPMELSGSASFFRENVTCTFGQRAPNQVAIEWSASYSATADLDLDTMFLWNHVRLVCPVPNNPRGKFTVRGETVLSINPDWSIGSTTRTIGISRDVPVICLAVPPPRVEDLTAKAEGFFAPRIEGVPARVEGLIAEKTAAVPGKVAALWAAVQEPMPLRGESWLSVNPVAGSVAAVAGSNGQVLSLVAAFDAQPVIDLVAERPEASIDTLQPNRQQLPAVRAEALSIPINVSLLELGAKRGDELALEIARALGAQ